MKNSSCLIVDMTASERQEAVSRPDAVAVLPVGATEQHGPHLPMGTDSLIGQLLINGLLEKRKETDVFYFAPQLQVSKSTEHLDFPGSLSLDRDLFFVCVTSAIQQLRAWGFHRIALLNTHGGNGPVLRSLLREAQAKGEEDLMLLQVSPELPECSKREQTYGIHAGEYETSLLLARVPGMCRMEKADTVWINEGLPHPDLQPENASATFAWISSDLSPSGTMGDATIASAEKGDLWIERAVDLILEQIRLRR
jgi:creatinine amidohydrolase